MKHKFSFLASLSVLLVTFISLHAIFPGPTSAWIIEKASAAYAKMASGKGIFHQKTLIENAVYPLPSSSQNSQHPQSHTDRSIIETWTDDHGNNIFLKREPQTEKIQEGTMTKRTGHPVPYYFYDDISRELEQIRKPGVFLGGFGGTPLEQHFLRVIDTTIADRELQFLLNQLYSSQGVSFILEPEYEENHKPNATEYPFDVMDTMALKNQQLAGQHPLDSLPQNNASLDIKSLNLHWPDQHPSHAQNPHVLFKIIITKQNGNMRAVKPDGTPLTPADQAQLKTQLHNELKQYKNLAWLIQKKEAAIQDNAYHCLARYQDQNHDWQTILSVAADDHAAYEVESSGSTRIASDPQNQGAMGLMSRSLDDLSSQKLTPEAIQKLLNHLKTFKNVQATQTTENGKKYYVVTIPSDQRTERFWFDAETYQLYRFENENKEKQEIGNPGDHQTFGTTKTTATILEADFIAENEAAKVFDPARFDMIADNRNHATFWWSLPSMHDGCYDPDDRLLSPTEKQKFLKSLPAKALQEFEQRKKAVIQDTQHDEGNG